jgi:hypothetical protein
VTARSNKKEQNLTSKQGKVTHKMTLRRQQFLNEVHGLVEGCGADCCTASLLLCCFLHFIPMRAAHCQLDFVAADSHTSLLLKKQEEIKLIKHKIITS